MTKPKTLSVSKLAFYAEDPVRFSAARGGAYNATSAKLGTKAHERIGRGPSVLLFILSVSAIIAALIYFKIVQI